MLFSTFDKRVLLAMGLTYFNQGFSVFTSLAIKDLYKQYMSLDPGYMQFLSSLTTLPWSFKLLYGITADNFPIGGSRRKAYVMICGSLMFLTLFALFLGLY